MKERKKWKNEFAVDEWNAKHPPGTRVRYWPIRDGSECRETTTRSEAWELGDGSPVVKIAGLAGGVHLDHLEVIAT